MTKTIPVGIDLGTTFSCIAYWDTKSKTHKVIPNTEGAFTTPSVVAFTVPKGNGTTERLVGMPAVNQSGRNPANTIYDAKRMIGRDFLDHEVQRDMKIWSFKVIQDTNGRPLIVCKYDGRERKFKPEEISSMVLTKLQEYADKHLNQKTKDCVITVPAYFDNR